MSILPTSWCYIEIEQVLQLLDTGKVIQQGWSPQCEKEPSDLDEWGVLKTTSIQEGAFLPHENKKLPETMEPRPAIEVKPGDILMTCAGPRNRCGVACFVKKTRGHLMMSGKMYRFRADRQMVEAKYLEAFLLSQEAKTAIDKMKTGINDSGLNLTHGRFKKLAVPIPPINEQKRIIAKIDELFSDLDKGIESLKATREQLTIYRHAVLKYAFEGKLTKQWRKGKKDKIESADEMLDHIRQEREKDYQQKLEVWEKAFLKWEEGGKKDKKPAKPRKQEEIQPNKDEFNGLPILPENWKWVLLSQLSHHIVDGTHKTPKYLNTGVPFISAKDINGFKISFDDTRFISETEHQELIKRCTPNKGNVLITKSGTIGRVAVVESDNEFSLFESVANVPVISPTSPYYIALVSYLAIAGVFGARNQKGVAVKHLHLENLRRLPIPLAPKYEQQEITETLEAILSVIDQQDKIVSENLKKADALRQSILKQTFSGKLVEQDPKDEPTSVLLERIKREKENTKKKKRRVA